MKKLLLGMLLAVGLNAHAQRAIDHLDRGLVAIKTTNGVYCNWRILAEEYYGVEYNLYRGDQKVNDKPLSVSNFTDKDGTTDSEYTVKAVVNGKEQEACKSVTPMANAYKEIKLAHEGIKSTLVPNDATCADVDGDGELEIIMKFDNLSEMEQSYPKYGPKINGVNTKEYSIFECMKLDGTRLWWINCGPNMGDFQNNEQNIMAYDWDGDGRAEAVMRACDGTTIHMADGTTYTVGDSTINIRGDYGGGVNWFLITQREYLLYIDGLTGKPYQCITYPLPLLESGENDVNAAWGDGYGHRASKHFFGAPYLDGRKPSIFLARGIYTRHKMIALDVDPATHKLSERWRWNCSSWGPWFGNGYHNYGVADVDWDGRDEIVYGSMVIDDNGKGLSTTGLGHGDAQHCSDFDPYRHGQEIFAALEDHPGNNYRDATTSKIYYRYVAEKDDGRSMMGNFSNEFPGCQGVSSRDPGLISSVTDAVLANGTKWNITQNFRIYWDGDLLEETHDYVNGKNTAVGIYKYGTGRIAELEGSLTNNDTKGTPCFQGDIFGDWREEVIARTADNNIRIYTTTASTPWRNYTLWHDHQYRNSMVWQMCGYNQPPHVSYFLGQLEGITIAPPPLTMTGREEVKDGGTIDASLGGQHVLVCETKDSKVSVAEGAQPAIVTFNVPSWIQGTNSDATDGNPTLIRTYYTCKVEGAGFTGDMQLVKQGDGTLQLPTDEQTYTGNTDVWAGTLSFNGSLKNSHLWLNRFATLSSDGGTFDDIRMDYASKLIPGGANHQGNITADTLQLGFGSRIVFDLYCNDITADVVTANMISIEKKTWTEGPAYLTPVFEFVLHTEADGSFTPGRYLLAHVPNLKGDISDIQIEGTGLTRKVTLVYENDNIYLDVQAMREATGIIWNGIQSDVWEIDGAANFTKVSDETSTSNTFVTGDNVYFDDSGSQTTVMLTGNLEAKTVEVNSTKAYIFSGTGALVGKTALLKNGKGMLTIKTENGYTGGTHLSGGKTIVSLLANSLSEKGNLGARSTDPNKFIMDNGAQLVTSVAVTQGSAMKMMSDEGGIITNANDFITEQPVSGTCLTKSGTGWLKLNANNSDLNQLVITAGTVQCQGVHTPAKTVVMQGGTLNESVGSGYTIEVAQGKQAAWNLANDQTYSNRILGKGTLTVSCPVRKGGSSPNYWYATRTPIACNLADFEGTLVPISNGDPSGRFTMSTSSGMPKGTMEVGSGVEIQNHGLSFRIGKLTGTGSLGGSCTFSNSESVGANTWLVGNDENWTNSVKVVSNANLIKVGTGRVTWKAENSNTGSTIIREGTLTLSTGGMFGTGSLVIEPEGTLLGINATNTALANSSVTVNGTMIPGSFYGATSGTLYFGNVNVTFGEEGRLVIGTRKNATCSSLAGINRLTFNGTISITPSATHTLQVGDSIRIWTANSMTGTPSFDMQGDVLWDTSRISEGLLFVTGINLGIEDVKTTRRDDDTYFDLRGRKINSRQMPKGIYLRNGKKVVVK